MESHTHYELYFPGWFKLLHTGPRGERIFDDGMYQPRKQIVILRVGGSSPLDYPKKRTKQALSVLVLFLF